MKARKLCSCNMLMQSSCRGMHLARYTGPVLSDRIQLLQQTLQLLSTVCPPCQRDIQLLLMWHWCAKPMLGYLLNWILRLQGKCWGTFRLQGCLFWLQVCRFWLQTCLFDGVTSLSWNALKPSTAYWSVLPELKLGVPLSVVQASSI